MGPYMWVSYGSIGAADQQWYLSRRKYSRDTPSRVRWGDDAVGEVRGKKEKKKEVKKFWS